MHCPALVQVICAELLKTWGQKGFESHVVQVQNFYKDLEKLLKISSQIVSQTLSVDPFLCHFLLK